MTDDTNTRAPTDAGGAVSEAAREDRCRDCDDTGVTIQTERQCSCDAGMALSAPQPLQQGGGVTRDWLIAIIKEHSFPSDAADMILERLALFASPDLGDLAGLYARLQSTKGPVGRPDIRDLRNPDGPEAARALRSLAADRDKAVGLLRDAREHVLSVHDHDTVEWIDAFLSSQTEGR